MSIPQFPSCFFWKSKIKDSRKDEIIKILSTLNDEQKEAVEEWVKDKLDECEWENNSIS